MGSFTKRPIDGERAGINKRKVIKEIRRGRIKLKSTKEATIQAQKKRLVDLAGEISQIRDPLEAEPLYKQFANAAASYPQEAFDPTDIQGIEKLSSLEDTERLRSLERNYYQGSCYVLLPLHHLVKLLSKKLPNNDKLVYLLRNSSNTAPEELETRNLRGLEYCLLDFAGRIPKGKNLDLYVNGKRIQVESGENYVKQDGKEVVRLRQKLDRLGIRASDSYTISKINDGGHKINTKLVIETVTRNYQDNGQQQSMMLSYIAVK